jgi:Flp pilus assembly pilin Flp
VLNQLQKSWIYGQVAIIEQGRLMARTVGERARRAARDERGQTPTEYLMIVGLMAAVIVTVFVTFYWNTVSGAARSWVTKVTQSILGTSIR